MRIKDIWPTLGQYEKPNKGTWVAGVKKQPTSNQKLRGRKHMLSYYFRYTHILTFMLVNENLAKIAKRKAKAMAQA